MRSAAQPGSTSATGRPNDSDHLADLYGGNHRTGDIAEGVGSVFVRYSNGAWQPVAFAVAVQLCQREPDRDVPSILLRFAHIWRCHLGQRIRLNKRHRTGELPLEYLRAGLLRRGELINGYGIWPERRIEPDWPFCILLVRPRNTRHVLYVHRILPDVLD